MKKQIDIFGEFAPAYTISNENQRWATSAVPNISRVLTVAGSGDQALFYHLNGAKQIDTFDKTQNARVIQDIKFTAIQHVSYHEYSNLLIDLFHVKDIKCIPTMKKLMPLLPRETIRIINTPGNYYLFGAGLDARYYPENIPTPAEYDYLKHTLKKPFNFICTDLYDLSTKITGKYDLINISNIFDYCYNAQQQGDILRKLSRHLVPGGHIVYLPQAEKFSYNKIHIPLQNSELNYLQKLQQKQTKMILFRYTQLAKMKQK